MKQEKVSFHVSTWVDIMIESVRNVSEHLLQSGIILFKFSKEHACIHLFKKTRIAANSLL